MGGKKRRKERREEEREGRREESNESQLPQIPQLLTAQCRHRCELMRWGRAENSWENRTLSQQGLCINCLLSICHACKQSLQLCLTLCNPTDCSPPDSAVHEDSPGKNTGVGCHAFLQGIFPTQGWDPRLLCLLHCKQILYLLSHQGSFIHHHPFNNREISCKVTGPEPLLAYPAAGNLFFRGKLGSVNENQIIQTALGPGCW